MTDEITYIKHVDRGWKTLGNQKASYQMQKLLQRKRSEIKTKNRCLDAKCDDFLKKINTARKAIAENPLDHNTEVLQGLGREKSFRRKNRHQLNT